MATMTILPMLARKRSLTDNCGTRCVVTVAVTHVNATSSVRGQNLCLGMWASVASGACAGSLRSATVRVVGRQFGRQ